MADENGNTLQWRMAQVEKWSADVEDKVSGHSVSLAEMEVTIKAHDAISKRIEDKLDSVNLWMRGIVGSLFVALILLVANLMLGKRI